MRKLKYILFLISLSLLSVYGNAQNATIDSLMSVLRNNNHDTVVVNTKIELAWELESIDQGKAAKYANEAAEKAKSIGFYKGLGDAYTIIGVLHGDINQHDSAIKYHYNALEIREAQQYKKGIASSCNNLGYEYSTIGNKSKALEYYLKSLNASESLGDKEGIASSLSNLGLFYYDIADYNLSLEKHLKALKLREEIGNKANISISLNNIGLVYEAKSDTNRALDFYKQALIIKRQIQDKQGIANVLNNMGAIYTNKGDFSNALDCYTNSLSIREELNDSYGISVVLNSIGSLYNVIASSNKLKHKSNEYYNKSLEFYKKAMIRLETVNDLELKATVLHNISEIYRKQRKYEEAINHIEKSIKISTEISNHLLRMRSYKLLSEVDSAMGLFDKAYHNHIKYSNLRDSIFANENIEKFKEMEVRFESDKKEKENQLLKKDNELKVSELRTSRKISYLVTAILILILAMAIVVLRGYNQKRKANLLLKHQNIEIAQQKEEILSQRDALEILNSDLSEQKEKITIQKNLIESKNIKITASIKYAKLIQQAILPTNEYIKKIFPESFVLFMPKDIVSGDFFWFEEDGNKKFFAAVDCTGHGVPGALMSIVGNNLLNQALNEHHIKEPHEILNHVCNGVSYTIRKNEEDPLVKDGMDLTLCCFNPDTYMLEFAGVHNPLYIIRNDCELFEFRTDNHQIGAGFDESFKSYNRFTFQLQPGDNIYSFTDGFMDQFHFETRRKFTSGRFKQTLKMVSTLSMPEQKAALLEIFNEWKKDSEQIDDVLLIGVRV